MADPFIVTLSIVSMGVSLVSLGLGIWNVRRSEQDRRIKIRVCLARMIELRGMSSMLSVNVVNIGKPAFEVSQIFFETDDGSQYAPLPSAFLPKYELPESVEASKSISRLFDSDSILERIADDMPTNDLILTAVVVTSTGSIERSKPVNVNPAKNKAVTEVVRSTLQ
ncbi:MAG: hypothetical protein JST12_21335 [Armatimonadetes bacterium]|nr:hypothetical protein [Armatimonadota bacterium]